MAFKHFFCKTDKGSQLLAVYSYRKILFIPWQSWHFQEDTLKSRALPDYLLCQHQKFVGKGHFFRRDSNNVLQNTSTLFTLCHGGEKETMLLKTPMGTLCLCMGAMSSPTTMVCLPILLNEEWSSQLPHHWKHSCKGGWLVYLGGE